MTTFDPFHPDFEDNPDPPWDPRYGGGPGDMYDPAEFPQEDNVSKINVGDKVRMPGVPFVVEVLEIKPCDELGGCDFADVGDGSGEVFRFADPETGEDDWMHTIEFEEA